MSIKILLTDLAHTTSVNNASIPVPLGIGYLKAYALTQHGNRVDIDLFKHPEKFLEAVGVAKPEIVGFANYGWNENLNRTVGGYVRKILPDTIIVAGGPNIDPSSRSRLEFLKKHDYLDGLILGSGEEPFSELIQWLKETPGDLNRLPQDVAWRDGGGIHETGARNLKKNIENIPSPYLSGHLDQFLEDGLVPMLETNRGCPFKCTFCAWGAAAKNLVQRMNFDISIAEINYVGKRSRSKNWIICDANFGILKRDVELARAIRKVKDRHGSPMKCHIWLAKNVTERNLEIAEILDDMVVPVMAVQSLDSEVLANIRRDNISLDTYVEYQKKFHTMGHRTYSDLIVPLPGETLKSHLAAIQTLCESGVDIIQCHNMRLLAGAETNSSETRDKYGYKTKYRLIHGDAGVYQCQDGSVLKCFEYEESLRETTTMNEENLFYLRKLHFLVEFFWNLEVYKPLLKMAQQFGVDTVHVLQEVLKTSEFPAESSGDTGLRLAEFFEDFDRKSHEEWFQSGNEIEAYFHEEENFDRLINQEFEKLNIMFSVLLLKDYKEVFDRVIWSMLSGFREIPHDLLADYAALTFAMFPPLDARQTEQAYAVPERFFEATVRDHIPGDTNVHLVESKQRKTLRAIIAESQNQTLSKILNIQDLTMRDLRLQVV